ncbi:MAG: substrate-binding domain-containing protein [Pseudomonadota bacterium]
MMTEDRTAMELAESGRRRFLRFFSCGLALGAAILKPSSIAGRSPLFLGVTTSVENSGLLAYLVETFSIGRDIQIRAVTAGTGAVLNLAARGDVDVVLVHSPDNERSFLRAGYGIDRRAVMRNRYVIVGPASDPAGIGDAADAVTAFTSIATRKAPFLSRGDESGTHHAERAIWRLVGIEPDQASGRESWYRETGSGQGATLNIAANTNAYTLTDDATWATFSNPGALELHVDKDEPALRNLYSIIRVNPERHAGLNVQDALAFTDWLTSKSGQSAILSFQVNGRPLFRPVGDLSG